jgi:hypothetical protein
MFGSASFSFARGEKRRDQLAFEADSSATRPSAAPRYAGPRANRHAQRHHPGSPKGAVLSAPRVVVSTVRSSPGRCEDHCPKVQAQLSGRSQDHVPARPVPPAGGRWATSRPRRPAPGKMARRRPWFRRGAASEHPAPVSARRAGGDRAEGPTGPAPARGRRRTPLFAKRGPPADPPTQGHRGERVTQGGGWSAQLVSIRLPPGWRERRRSQKGDRPRLKRQTSRGRFVAVPPIRH